jgi:hypothetical protein
MFTASKKIMGLDSFQDELEAAVCSLFEKTEEQGQGFHEAVDQVSTEFDVSPLDLAAVYSRQIHLTEAL